MEPSQWKTIDYLIFMYCFLMGACSYMLILGS